MVGFFKLKFIGCEAEHSEAERLGGADARARGLAERFLIYHFEFSDELGGRMETGEACLDESLPRARNGSGLVGNKGKSVLLSFTLKPGQEFLAFGQRNATAILQEFPFLIGADFFRGISYE